MIDEYNSRLFCNEDPSLIENYNEAIKDNKTWVIHHKLEIELNKTVKELKKLGLYYKRPANELIFLTKSEHVSLHRKGVGLSEQQKKKISEKNKQTPKYKWLTPNGEIKTMMYRHAKRWHKDWVLLDESSNQIPEIKHAEPLF